MRSSGFDPVSTEVVSKRLMTMKIVVIAIIGALILRLWFLQIVNGPRYRTQSENNRIHLQKIPPFRGMILDRNGELLVDNRPAYNLYVIPEDIQDQDELLENLEILLAYNSKEAREKIKNISKRYRFNPVLIKRNISREELAVIETNLYNLPGVVIEVKPQRNYVFGEFASHLIGYLGEISEKQLSSGKYGDTSPGDLIGKYGVEGRWQEYLNGLSGGMQMEVDAAGRKLRVISRKPPMPGLNLSLTIDVKLQLLAEKLMEDKKGAIVALDPNNGEILAMASNPGFDPNLFISGIDNKEWGKMISSRDYPLQNRAVSGQYPPGSVFKIVVALAGLEEGTIDPEEKIVCTGSYVLGNHTYRCWKRYGHGEVDLHRAIRESCDVYFYKMGNRLGVDNIARYAKMCGLGEKTGFDLTYEKAGLIPTQEWKLKKWGIPWQSGETVSTSIGQSFVLVTPIQTARLISTIFNGGKIYQPKCVKWIGNENGYAYRFIPTLVGSLNVKKENLDLIKDALTAAVEEPHGTASMARVKGIKVAGKTGTAQIISLEAEDKYGKEGEIPPQFRDHAWFVAIAPVNDPKIALSILIEHGGHGGSTSAPIAAELIKAYLGNKG